MQTAIEHITERIGERVVALLATTADLGRLATRVKKDEREFYVIDECEVIPDDTKHYVGFHYCKGINPAPANKKDSWDKTGKGSITLSLNMSFTLLGFQGCGQHDFIPLLSAFVDSRYDERCGCRKGVSGEVEFVSATHNPIEVMKQFPPDMWGKIQHCQQEMAAIHIEYRMIMKACTLACETNQQEVVVAP